MYDSGGDSSQDDPQAPMITSTIGDLGAIRRDTSDDEEDDSDAHDGFTHSQRTHGTQLFVTAYESRVSYDDDRRIHLLKATETGEEETNQRSAPAHSPTTHRATRSTRSATSLVGGVGLASGVAGGVRSPDDGSPSVTLGASIGARRVNASPAPAIIAGQQAGNSGNASTDVGISPRIGADHKRMMLLAAARGAMDSVDQQQRQQQQAAIVAALNNTITTTTTLAAHSSPLLHMPLHPTGSPFPLVDRHDSPQPVPPVPLAIEHSSPYLHNRTNQSSPIPTAVRATMHIATPMHENVLPDSMGMLTQPQLNDNFPSSYQPRRMSAREAIMNPSLVDENAHYHMEQYASGAVAVPAVESRSHRSSGDGDRRHRDRDRDSERAHKKHKRRERDRERDKDRDRDRDRDRSRGDRDRDRDRDVSHKRKHSSEPHSSHSKAPRTHAHPSAPHPPRVKQEHDSLPPSRPASGPAAGGGVFFPETDDDFFGASTGIPATVTRIQPRPNVKRPHRTEVSLAEKSRERSKDAKSFAQSINLVDPDPSLVRVSDDIDVDDGSSRAAVIGSAAGAGRMELSLHPSAPVTPQRRMRASERFQLADDDDADARNMQHAPGSGSGSKRRRGRMGPLEDALTRAMAVNNRIANRPINAQINLSASQVAKTPTDVQRDADMMIVRVLSCEQHFGSRFALCSLASKPIQPTHLYADPVSSLMSPPPILISQTANISRYVARITNTAVSSIPPSMLCLIHFPLEDHTYTGANTDRPKLSDFPDCFIRIRNPVGRFVSDGCMPVYCGVTSWDRLAIPDDVTRIRHAETNLWKHAGEECTRIEQREKAAEEAFAAAEAAITRQKPHSHAADRMIDIDDDAMQFDVPVNANASGEFNLARVPSKPEVRPSLSSRVLPIDSSRWSEKYSSYHPRHLRPDQLHELFADRRNDTIDIADINSHIDPAEFIIAGIVQKVNWRGVNINPTEEQLRAASIDPAAPSASFFIQDGSGFVVEVLVPTPLVSSWYPILSVGPGGWVSMIDLDQVDDITTARTNQPHRQELHRALLPPQLRSEANKPWTVLTVTEKSAFQLNLHTRDFTPLKVESESIDSTPFVRPYPLTPLNRIAELNSVSEARSLARVHIAGRIAHIYNHSRLTWQVYLTDASLCNESTPRRTPTLVIDVPHREHHHLIDTFFHVNSFIAFRDVILAYDEVDAVPILRTDTYTEIVRLITQEEYEQLPSHQPMPAARKRHAIVGIIGTIVDAIEKPRVSASCCHCQTLIDSPFANSNSLRTTGCRLFVCHHCAYPNMIDLTPQFWLHSAIVAVEIDGIPNKRFRVRIESDNLQTLFAEKDEQAKAKAFKSIEAFKAALISQPINATCIFVPTPRPMSSVTLSDPDADGRISFAVATRVACPGGAFATASQVSSEPSQYTQGNTPPEQVAMTRNKQRTR